MRTRASAWMIGLAVLAGQPAAPRDAVPIDPVAAICDAFRSHDVVAVSELLKPYDARSMRCYPVSTRINHVANDDAECSQRIELLESQNPLFA